MKKYLIVKTKKVINTVNRGLYLQIGGAIHGSDYGTGHIR
jgi:hypothetical protein